MCYSKNESHTKSPYSTSLHSFQGYLPRGPIIGQISLLTTIPKNKAPNAEKRLLAVPKGYKKLNATSPDKSVYRCWNMAEHRESIY
jgi:hypothetical protein